MASNRMEKLKARRTDPTVIKAAAIREAFDSIAEEEPIKYAVGTMQPIDPAYAKTTFEEGDRVKNQLDKALNIGIPKLASFEYQGSATNGTHIKVHSDLDLLAIHEYFYTIQPPGKPSVPYTGDVLADLRDLRLSCARALKSAFPAVTVDDAPGKCIAMQGGSLRRKMDIVISNWWHSVDYQNNRIPIYMGIQIYDSKANERVENNPFLHNYRIDERDRKLNGNVRKVARLLKSLKYDADSPVNISSYDITSIAWSMPDDFMQAANGQELKLVENARSFLKWLIENDINRESYYVPNCMRKIFGANGASVNGLRALYKEIQDLVDEINRGFARTMRKLSEARVTY